MKHPTKPGQKCRVIRTASPRGLAVNQEVFTRWAHRETLRLDKIEGGKVVGVEDLGIVWRVQGEGLAKLPKNQPETGSVPADQADFPAVWLEVIDEETPSEGISADEKKLVDTGTSWI